MFDYVGKYIQDSMGNMLPMTQDIVAQFVCHDGARVWVQSPTGDSTDSLTFAHFAGSARGTINRMCDGKMVRIHREMKYDYKAELWGYFNTLYFA